MVTRIEVEKVIQSGEIATLVYKNEKRTINPVEILDSANGKSDVLVAQEEGKGWRRYSIDRISELELI